MQVQSLGQEDTMEGEWQPTPVFLLGASHRQRSLAGYSPCGSEELDMTEATARKSTSLAQPKKQGFPAEKLKVKVAQSCPTPWDPTDSSPWNSPGQNTGMAILSILQGIFPTQGSNPGLLHCRRILYQLSHKGSPSCCELLSKGKACG